MGKLSIEWGEHLLTGIAGDLTSPAFTKMCDSIQEVKGKSEPYSLTGSLPLVLDIDVVKTGKNTSGRREVSRSRNSFVCNNEL